MNKDFCLDYYRMTGIKYRFGIKSILNMFYYHNLRFVKLWRKTNKKKSFLNKYRLNRYAKKYGLEISPDCSIGKGLYIGHPYNITICGGAKLGNNVNIHKGCTIGRENRGLRSGTPKIGNKVFIGINSTVVGKISIGDDVMIAPNTFVNFDVPSHSIVIGNPAVIHHKENATTGYIGFIVGEENDT